MREMTNGSIHVLIIMLSGTHGTGTIHADFGLVCLVDRYRNQFDFIKKIKGPGILL